MAVVITHTKVSAIADDPVAAAAGEVLPSHWNANHSLSGVGTMAEQNANAVAITGGAESGVTHSGDTIGTYLDHTAVAAPSYVEGRTWYDSTAHALAYYNDSSTATVHIGQDLQFKVINNTGSSIANGAPVYITSTSSGQTYPNIALAKADAAGTANVAGLTNGSIASGAIGYVTAQGVIDNVNTVTFTVGQVLYLSPYSAGQLMNTVPPTGIAVQVGIVSYVNSSTGKIYVKQTTPLAVSASILTGQVAIANGGTGASTKATAFNALSPMSAAGDVIYGGTSGAGTALPIGTAGQVLTVNSGATAPQWSTPTTGTVTSVSGTGTVNGLSLSGTVTSSGSLTLGGTLDLSSPPAIGGTTAAAGTFTTLIGGSGSANYEQITGGATGKAVQFQSLGSDAAVSLAIQSKGTGAIDLAAGSSGVNISNGGTVTALTTTSVAGTYTSIPTVAITAPTTAGGVQATANATMRVTGSNSATIVSGGTGYTASDVLTVTGGTGGSTQITVGTVSAGVIQTVTVTSNPQYTVLPTNPVSVTGGTGSGATFNLVYYVNSFTITAAGSGYVEQPTVTFSGGGGSGAAAYATVGSGTIVKSIGSTFSIYTPGGESFRVVDNGSTNANFYAVYGKVAGGSPTLIASGSDAAVNATIATKSTGAIFFRTDAFSSNVQQMAVAHTASAVNYVQVAGAATGGAASIQSQGSDGNVLIAYATKGTGSHSFYSGGIANRQVRIDGTITAVNYLDFYGAVANSAPSFRVGGTDTDIQLSLVPKGLGIVLMNQQTPAAVTATGTLTIANLLTQIITSTSATAVSLTLPTGTLSDAGVSGGTSAVNTSFDYSIINLGSAVGDVTMVAGTAHTIVGSVTVAVGTSGRFRCRKTATNTFVSYRV
jgi:hypothetical protein